MRAAENEVQKRPILRAAISIVGALAIMGTFFGIGWVLAFHPRVFFGILAALGGIAFFLFIAWMIWDGLE